MRGGEKRKKNSVVHTNPCTDKKARKRMLALLAKENREGKKAAP